MKVNGWQNIFEPSTDFEFPKQSSNQTSHQSISMTMRDTRFVKEINVTTWFPVFFVLVISDACVIPIYKRKSVSILMHLPIGIKNIGCVEAQICIDMLQSYSLLAQIQEFVWGPWIAYLCLLAAALKLLIWTKIPRIFKAFMTYKITINMRLTLQTKWVFVFYEKRIRTSGST